MSYLLDTNVLSELVKRRKNTGVLDWLTATEGADHHVSVMSIGEIRRGIELLRLRRDRLQAERFAAWLDKTIAEFGTRIVPVTTAIAEQWGHYDARRPRPIVNGLIGATAAAYGWTLVTRNVKDFADLGVDLHNPFTEEVEG